MATQLGTNKNKHLYHRPVKPFSTPPLHENLQENRANFEDLAVFLNVYKTVQKQTEPVLNKIRNKEPVKCKPSVPKDGKTKDNE